jgi:hypothetical protein
MERPTKEQVMERLRKRCDMSSGCWVIDGWLNAEGYGQFSVNNRCRLAHRAVYELLVGAIPPGMQLDHLCRVRRCVNPAHLEPVTNRENSMRGTGFSALNAAKTHCPKGHAYSVTNTRVDKLGKRFCRACQREWWRARHALRGEPCA